MKRLNDLFTLMASPVREYIEYEKAKLRIEKCNRIYEKQKRRCLKTGFGLPWHIMNSTDADDLIEIDLYEESHPLISKLSIFR
jgi:hypothetical protein